MPLYEFRCQDCGIFDLWRAMAESSAPAHCPTCNETAKRIFSPPALLSSTLRLHKRENPEPKLVKRDAEPAAPRVTPSNCGRPWMISH
jgi:putative FmdB family regulatory protein